MSDIHGCFDKYKEMLSLIEFTLGCVVNRNVL